MGASFFFELYGAIRELVASVTHTSVNYTVPLSATFRGDERAATHKTQAAEFCAYLNLERYKILCYQPELLIKTKPTRERFVVADGPLKMRICGSRWLCSKSLSL
jgi:para-aminobenzoate synthetase/4-amino-4-deoxychorismate lyase